MVLRSQCCSFQKDFSWSLLLSSAAWVISSSRSDPPFYGFGLYLSFPFLNRHEAVVDGLAGALLGCVKMSDAISMACTHRTYCFGVLKFHKDGPLSKNRRKYSHMHEEVIVCSGNLTRLSSEVCRAMLDEHDDVLDILQRILDHNRLC